MATHKQKRLSHMLLFSDDYLHAKNLRDPLIPSRDIDGQRILQSDWVGSTIAHITSRVVVSDAIFL